MVATCRVAGAVVTCRSSVHCQVSERPPGSTVGSTTAEAGLIPDCRRLVLSQGSRNEIEERARPIRACFAGHEDGGPIRSHRRPSSRPVLGREVVSKARAPTIREPRHRLRPMWGSPESGSADRCAHQWLGSHSARLRGASLCREVIPIPTLAFLPFVGMGPNDDDRVSCSTTPGRPRSSNSPRSHSSAS